MAATLREDWKFFLAIALFFGAVALSTYLDLNPPFAKDPPYEGKMHAQALE